MSEHGFDDGSPDHEDSHARIRHDVAHGGMTAAEYDALPEGHLRPELIDGVLHIPPGRDATHQTLTALLAADLFQSAPVDIGVTQAVEIRLAPNLRYIPDILAVRVNTLGGKDRHQFDAHEVVLVGEVVSPTTRSMDRILKPRHYAEYGVPWFWRIETEDGLLVTAHEIDPTTGIYVESGKFTDRITLDAPWPIDLDLTPLVRALDL
ncbi:Uma2 family endonuclease [Longispora sp. K20-0274]|uniref:Uma2 family endonuclease n=1 Tax=Longispora sp. K20-0274 TaxID=3088255 RepID=UPI00399BDF0A